MFSPIYGEMKVLHKDKTTAIFTSSRLNAKPRRSMESIKVFLEQNPPKVIQTSNGTLKLFPMENKDFVLGNSFLKEYKRYVLNSVNIGKYLYFEMPSEWMRAEDYFEKSVYEQEVKYLQEVYNYIHDEYLKKLKSDIETSIQNEHAKENPMHFAHMTNNHLHEYTAKEQYARLSGEIEREPYLGSIVLNGKKIYIGKHAIKEKNVIDWADKRSEYFYQYSFFLKDTSIHIEQVRRYYLMYDRLFMYYDEYNEKLGLKVQDELLTKALKAHRSDKQVTNIIESIQSQQFEIIKQDLDKNMIVLGCAGSGKTMILFHRLYHVLYNNPDFGIENLILLSPTNLLVNQTDILAKQLRVQDVNKFTVREFVYNVYTSYFNTYKDLKDVIIEVEDPNDINTNMYDINYLTEKVLDINSKTYSSEYLTCQEVKINIALSNIIRVLLNGDVSLKDTKLSKILEQYQNSVKLCKKLSVENLKALEVSLESNIAIYDDAEIVVKILEIFEPLHVFDEETHSKNKFFGRLRKFDSKMDRVKEYLKPLKKLTRKLDLDTMQKMHFKDAHECIQYCVSHSQRLQNMRLTSLQKMLEEIAQIELDNVYEIYFFCSECLEVMLAYK